MNPFKPCFPNGIKEFPFSPEDIRDIWAAAKDLRDQGLGMDKIIKTISDATKLDPYHVAQAIQSPKTIPRSMAMDAWTKAGAYRRMVSNAKVRVLDAQKSPALKAIGRLYDIPRSLETVGHWGVYTGTHAGEMLYMPSEWGRWMNQWQRGWRAVSKNYFDKAVEQHMANVPDHDLYSAAGLDNDPYSKALGIYADKSLLPDKLRAGPRGYGTLALARDVLMKNLVERAQRIDPNVLKDKAQLHDMATVVNHVWGSAKLPQGWGPVMSRLIFATRLLPARLLSTFVDIPKAAGTFVNWPNASAAQRVAALFTARRLVQVLVLHHATVAANAAWNYAHGGAKVNLANPDQVGDWMAYKIGGLTIRPPSAILEAERLVAGMAYATLAGGKKTAGDVLKDYASGKLNPAIHLAQEVATGVNWLGERTPFRGLKERITGEPPLNQWGKPVTREETPMQYTLGRTLPIPLGGSSREIYSMFKQEGLNSAETSSWMRALSSPNVLGTGALESQGVTAHENIPYKQKPPNKLAQFLQQHAQALGQ